MNDLESVVNKFSIALKGEGAGHPFRGNQYSDGSGGGSSGSMGDQVASDNHAKANSSTTPGKRKMPSEMTQQEYDALPVVYRGINSGNANNQGHVYVTPDRSIAASHGRVQEYKILPGSKLYPDPEVEGEQDDTLNGLQSLKHGSAVIHSDDLIPNFRYSSWKH